MSTEELMTTKYRTVSRAAAIAQEAVKLLESLEKHVPQDRKVLFARSIKMPLIRKHQKAAGQMLFWQDKDGVEQWMANRDQSPS